MATCVDNTYKTAATWNSSAFTDVIGGGIRRNLEYTETAPGTRVTALHAVNRVTTEADVEYVDLATPRTTATIANLVFTLTKMGISGGTKTVTCSNFRAKDYDMNFSQQPHTQRETFRHDPQGTEDLAPVSVA